MSEKEKEDHYISMGIPFHIKKKRLYHRSIGLFTNCILKYFKPCKLFLHDDENYGGLKDSLVKFLSIILERLRDHPELGTNGSQQRLQLEPYECKSANQRGIFNNQENFENDGM